MVWTMNATTTVPVKNSTGRSLVYARQAFPGMEGSAVILMSANLANTNVPRIPSVWIRLVRIDVFVRLDTQEMVGTVKGSLKKRLKSATEAITAVITSHPRVKQRSQLRVSLIR